MGTGVYSYFVYEKADVGSNPTPRAITWQNPASHILHLVKTPPHRLADVSPCSAPLHLLPSHQRAESRAEKSRKGPPQLSSTRKASSLPSRALRPSSRLEVTHKLGFEAEDGLKALEG